MASSAKMGTWVEVAEPQTARAGGGRQVKEPQLYLLHQTPPHSESRRNALGARFGPLPSALSGKGTQGEMVECCRAVNLDPGSTRVSNSYRNAGGRGLLTHVQDGSRTVSTAWRKQVVVVLGAVGQAAALEEGTRANLLFAVTADEVLWMPRLP